MLYNNLYKNNHINTNSYETSINNVVGYFLYNLSTSYTIYKNKMIEMNLPYLNNSENNIDTVLHVVKYGNVTSEKRLCEIISTFYNKEKNEIGANFKFIVNTTYNDNRDLYLYYIKKGINIFNVSDEAFTNKCYRNTELKYDLTNKYRKYSLYQGQITEHSNNNNLYYLTMEKDVSLLQLKDNYSNLPFKCLKKVSKLYQNISFWFYFILFIIVIGITVLFQFIKDDFSNEMIKNDELDNESPDKYLFEYFIFNLLHYHFLLTLIIKSILSPILFKIWIFFFNISNLFGFNAILYNEKLLEKRIYDKHRDNFGYPMKREFGKIISSILISMILTILIKLINITSFSEKETLVLLHSETRERRFKDEFTKNKMIIRNIAGFIMLFIIMIMWLYSIGFCYLYYHAQKSWFYSGIWSLFWVWFIFAPLFLFLISLFQTFIHNNEKLIQYSYYMKTLFCY